MKRQRRNRESTAYHEAGHAVAAFVLSLKIGKRGVSIVPDREKDLVGLAMSLSKSENGRTVP
jgi:ATP-dependent Zn protease